MAALIYEIVWQKVLFAAYGVNIESITIVVSLFMFGLGVGSLIGGWLPSRFPNRLPQMFVICECGIGIFGLASLPLIHAVADRTLHLSMTGITLAVYALLFLPTMLMGATLPILVTHLHKHYRNIGKSVGRLYFFNTIGSAAACLLTVDVLFVFLGKQSTVAIAALLNFAVAALVAAYISGLFLIGAFIYHFSVPFFTQATVLSKSLGLLLSYGMVAAVAFIFGNVLPIISHYGIRQGKAVGQSLSWIYMANIVGATAGPMVTGFLLMDLFTLEQNILFISFASVAIAAGVYISTPSGAPAKLRFAGTAVLVAASIAAFHSASYAHLFEKLRYGPRYGSKPKHNHLVQNRSGVVATEPSENGDIIFGGGGYDGRFNLDPVLNSNGIRRTYMITALHPNPTEVLDGYSHPGSQPPWR